MKERMTPTNGTRERLTVAIVGAGGVAETHAAVLKSMPQVRLTAICDSAPGKAEAFQQKFGLIGSYASLRTMLADLKPDVVHIATPPFAHAANAVECLGAGVNIFVEKPFALSSAEADQVARAAARSRGAVGVNHNATFNPALLRMFDAIREERLGGIEHAMVCFNMPLPVTTGPYTHWLFRGTENLIFELAPHPISVILRLFGRVLSSHTLVTGEKILPSGVRFYPTWQVSMECERGTAQLYLSGAGDFEDLWVRIEAEDGAAQADLRRNTFRIVEKSHLMRPNDDLRDCLSGAAGLVRDGLHNYRNYVLSALGKPAPYPMQYAGMSNSIRAYYAALLTGTTPPAGLAQGIAVTHACEAVVAPVLESALATPVG